MYACVRQARSAVRAFQARRVRPVRQGFQARRALRVRRDYRVPQAHRVQRDYRAFQARRVVRVYALGSAGIALVLSLCLNPLAGALLEGMYWFFSYHFTIGPVLFVVPVFALLGAVIPYVMYRHAAKHSVVERLREV